MERALQIQDLDNVKSQSADPYSLLFRNFSQQARFSPYGEKFEQFMMDAAEVYLKLAKYYLPDDELIPAIGANEIVNIAEFRKAALLRNQIKIEPQEDTLETKFGKQLTMNHILQYAGAQLGKDAIGKVIRNMPFGNFDTAFDDLTIDYDTAENAILAIERGQMPVITKHSDHEYMIKRLTLRIGQADFQTLQPNTQQMFHRQLKVHETVFAKRLAEIKAAQSEFIPTGGPLIACDMYIKSEDGKQPKRARIPQQALNDLLEKMSTQGATMDQLENMEQGNLADIAKQYMAGAGKRPVPPGAPQVH